MVVVQPEIVFPVRLMQAGAEWLQTIWNKQAVYSGW
jgi:hypothetical protein